MGIEVSANFELWNNAADNNKLFIANELMRLLDPGSRVFEIGSGSGQHAAYFVDQLDSVSWQPADREPYFDALRRNLASLSHARIDEPIYLDLAQFDASGRFDAVFCANVVHIMPEALIPNLVQGAGNLLAAGGLFILYGPYKYNGAFTTPSNEKFDSWLRSRDSLSGIRDIERVVSEAINHGLELIEDVPMPANNQLLVFRRSGET